MSIYADLAGLLLANMPFLLRQLSLGTSDSVREVSAMPNAI